MTYTRSDAGFIAGYAARRYASAISKVRSGTPTERWLAQPAAAHWFRVQEAADAVLDALDGHDMGHDAHAALAALVSDDVAIALEHARRVDAGRLAA
jgi:hypothetical protein